MIYRDEKKYDVDDYEFTTRMIPLQKSDEKGLDKIAKFLHNIDAYGGGDVPEAVLKGVQEAVDKAGWAPKAHKVIIVIGDAPPRPETANDLHNLCSKWKEAGNVLSCIDTTGKGKIQPEFTLMASLGGGETIALKSEGDVVRQLFLLSFDAKFRKEAENAYDSAADENTPADAPTGKGWGGGTPPRPVRSP